MNIKDCEVNKKVIAKNNISQQIKKGDKVEIRYVQENPPFIDVDNGDVIVTERSPNNFIPINKFKVGERIVIKEANECFYSEVFGFMYDDEEDYIYAITFKYNDETYFRIVCEGEIYPLKKRDELKPGDKFIDNSDCIVEVIASEICEVNNQIKYFGKKELSGFVSTWWPKQIKEIDYS